MQYSFAFGSCYLAQVYYEAYAAASLRLPILQDIAPVDGRNALLPPERVKQAGRPRKKRIRSTHEDVGRAVRKRSGCKRCGRDATHNIRSCPIEQAAAQT